ncbi:MULTISPECIES: sulfocyanin-like copper-binding protein [unclassified Clostridium]|uniref:sulfocyanin-like copper-binding protein n=1 Tax=unclassified Clostridium TaxID=2614128 RepID=UPI000FFE1893|nr:sulfocyanin-like copper-binding protein [Clostridium sp. JN-9]QAT41318.1 plastocyanin [Clostridium sp. JN-9]
MKSSKLLWSSLIALSLLLCASYIIPKSYYRTNAAAKVVNNNSSNLNTANNYSRRGNESYGYGMMGRNRGYNSSSYLQGLISEDKVNEEIKNSTANAKIDKQSNSITYSGNSINIVLLASGKQADDKFEAAGLINPTIYIPRDSTVTLELINEDEDVSHALEITSAAPPYGYMSMMQGEVYPGSFINPIPSAANGKLYSASVSFTASHDGSFYYICQYPGHAAQGMYGKIIVQ